MPPTPQAPAETPAPLPSPAYRFRAFISYRHADNDPRREGLGNRWADWLHSQLENFRVPPELIGKQGRGGIPIPPRIYPVFQDEKELPTNADLGAMVREALGQSEFLIVLCSPRAVESRYVDEEIRHFKQLGRGHRILPLILAGEPNASEGKKGFAPTDECFPRSLRFQVTPAGEVLEGTRDIEPICADLRGEGGRESRIGDRASAHFLEQGKLKLIAGLLGINYDELVQRDKQRQLNEARARQRRLAYLSAGFALLALAAVIAGVFAWHQKGVAQRERDGSEGLASFIVFDLRDRLKPLGRVDLLDAASQKALEHYRQRQKTFMTTAEQRTLAISLMNIGDVIAASGRGVEKTEQAYREALGILRSLARTHPGETERLRDLSICLDGLGKCSQSQGRGPEAEASFREALDISRTLLAAAPTDARCQRDLSISLDNVASVCLAQGKAGEAEAAYRESLTLRRTLAEAAPQDEDAQRLLSIALENLAQLQVLQGKGPEAESAYTEALGIAKTLLERAPADADRQRDLSISLENVCKVLLAAGKLSQAEETLQESLSLRRQLVRADPSNANAQRDLTVSLSAAAQIQHSRGNAPAAISLHTEALALRRALAEADSGNAQKRRDLASTLDHLAQLHLAQGHDDASEAAYLEALSLHRGLVAADPANAELQRELSISLDNAGQRQLRAGNASEAEQLFRESLGIAQRLAAQDPHSAEKQRDLSISISNLAQLHYNQGRHAEAAAAYRQSIALREKLAALDPSNTLWQKDLESEKANLGIALEASGNRGP